MNVSFNVSSEFYKGDVYALTMNVGCGHIPAGRGSLNFPVQLEIGKRVLSANTGCRLVVGGTPAF